jgi:phospholipase A1
MYANVMSGPKVPVILIPGISGTQLVYEEEEDIIDMTYNAWFPSYSYDKIPPTLPNAHFEQLYGRFDPVDKTVKRIADEKFLRWRQVDTLIDGGLESIEDLSFSEVLPLIKNEIQQYSALVAALVDKGYERNKTIFGFGYDWRQSNYNHTSDLQQRILDAMAISGCNKVDIICHSMGGIVTKTFLAREPDFFGAYVRKWIACGTPFLGSPALTAESLLVGVELAESVVQSLFVPDAEHVLNAMVRYPSVIELTPKPNYKWRFGNPNAYVWVKEDDGRVVKRIFPVVDLQDMQTKVLKGHTFIHMTEPLPPKKYPLPQVYLWESDPNVWTRGRQIQYFCHTAKLPSTVQFYCIYGTSNLTPFGVEFGSMEKPASSDLTNLSALPRKNSFVDGDQTVPKESALGHGFKAVHTRVVKSTHTKMLLDPELIGHVMSFLNV